MNILQSYVMDRKSINKNSEDLRSVIVYVCVCFINEIVVKCVNGFDFKTKYKLKTCHEFGKAAAFNQMCLINSTKA